MRRKLRKTRVGVAVAVGAAALLATPGVASAGSYHHHHQPKAPVVSAPLADGLAGPLQFEVNRFDSKVLVGQSFSGTVSTIDRHGHQHDLFNDPGVDGVAYGPLWGSVVYTHTESAGPEGPPPPGFVPDAQLRFRAANGTTKTIADTYDYESSKNPDGNQHYGFMGLSADCAAQLPPDAGILPYTGIVDSHPYAITSVPGGWLVAEAAGNDILFVDGRGHIRTIAVLPPAAPVTVSADAATANQLPPCVVGSQFVAEPVPTDVEVGRDGMLYVSSLPGGPEDPSLGARGSVYRVNPWNGKVKQIATGFSGAVNLAISPSGTIYVSELFGNQISKVVGHHGVPVVSVPAPSGLEWANNRLYAGIDTMASGKIVTIKV
jgi:hypothetical protein